MVGTGPILDGSDRPAKLTEMSPLHDLTVVEFAGSVAGAYCAKLFADQGARVLVVGAGDLTPHQRRYMRAATTTCDEVTIAAAGFDGVDVIIESSAPWPLSPRTIAAPNAVRVQISPFGMAGPRAGWQSTDLVDYAISGHAYLYGDPEREPLRGPPDQPAVAAGLFGFIGAMAGLFARTQLGHGQIVDVSHVQVMVALHQVTLLRWMMTRNILCRMGNRYTGQGQPNGPYPCADGTIAITCVTDPQVEGLLAVTGLSHLLDHPDITSPMDFQSHPHLLDEPLIEWLSTQQVADVVELFQAMRIPTAPLLDTAELLADPQLVSRSFFRPLPDAPELLVPGPPFTVSHHQPSRGGGWKPGDAANGPLAGLRVLDLARVWAGPLCSRILSDLGADVVWVEAPWSRGPKQLPQSLLDATRYYPDDSQGERPWNRNAHLVNFSLGKRSLALDLDTNAGREVLARLIPHNHVLLENFSTRVMPQFGFDEDRLHELNPDLIYLTMPGYGRTGPGENWLAYGSCIDSHAGLSSLNGYRGEVPWKGGIAWPDPIAGLHAAGAVLTALWSTQAAGGGGSTIEAAQFESTIAAIGDRVLEAQIDGPYIPDGNRQPGYIAQGVYPCRGDDEWIAISAPDHATFSAWIEVLGLAAANADDHDGFDDLIASTTKTYDAGELTERLQAAGVPAGPTFKAPDVMADPHLAARAAWATVDQPDVGPFTSPVTPIVMASSPVAVRRPAPTLGQHNAEVLTAAGFAATEIASLASGAVITTEPPI